MAEPAIRSMSATEFCAWEDGTDTRYELIDGMPVAMTPGSANHVQIAANAQQIVSLAIASRRPCRTVQGGGLRLHEGPPGKVYIPDLLMTCEPIDGRHLYEAPQLVVEVLLPSTQSCDKQVKLPTYGDVPSIEEIWLIHSRMRLVTVWERVEAGWHAGLPLIGQATFASRCLGRGVDLDALYDLTNL